MTNKKNEPETSTEILSEVQRHYVVFTIVNLVFAAVILFFVFTFISPYVATLEPVSKRELIEQTNRIESLPSATRKWEIMELLQNYESQKHVSSLSLELGSKLLFLFAIMYAIIGAAQVVICWKWKRSLQVRPEASTD